MAFLQLDPVEREEVNGVSIQPCN